MKYINIIDLKDFDCYQNINCRLLYLELCSLMDVKTRNVSFSQRHMERVLPCSYSAIRHALSLLLRDGVVAQVSAQDVAQVSAHRIAQCVTHLHIMSYNELSGTNSALTSADSIADNVADNVARSSNLSNNGIEKFKFKNSKITLTRAEEFLSNFPREKISLYVDIAEDKAPYFVETFCARMRVKNREWRDDNDLLSHFLDWSYKNKKSLLHRADERAKVEEQAQEPAPVEAPHPSWLTSAEWEWICKTVRSGDYAPEVKLEYDKGMAALRSKK